MPGHDVIIIGGGLAGLGAAVDLGKAGRDVVLLEARERLGGRVFTQRHAGVDVPIELGPEWVDLDASVAPLLESAGSTLVAHAREFRLRRGAGYVDGEKRLEEIGRAIETLNAAEATDVSLQEAMARHGGLDDAQRDLLLNFAAGFNAADPARVGVRWLQAVQDSAPPDASGYRTPQGLDTAIRALRDCLPSSVEVRSSTVVTQVEWMPGAVTVHAEREGQAERVRARRAIIALPHGVLTAAPGSKGAVRFSPSLDARHAALGALATGSVIKIALVFREPIWQRNQHLRDALFVQDYAQPLPTWWTTVVPASPIILGWAGGIQASRLAAEPADTIQLALTSFAAAWDIPLAHVREQFVDAVWHDWNADPFARGAYTYVAAGGIMAPSELAAPMHDTLYFAGEATVGEGRNATMQGALDSGRRAAREILEEPR